MNWGFLLFRGSYTYKKGLIVQSSSKTTQLLDPPSLLATTQPNTNVTILIRIVIKEKLAQFVFNRIAIGLATINPIIA